jgi:uncharacterized protein (TIGR00369 family)
MTNNTSRPFFDLLGITPVSAGGGRAVLELAENPALANSRQDVHGGAIFTLLDVACAGAARSTVAEGGGVATITLTVTYLAPGRGRLRGSGTVLRAGQTIIAVEAEATDDAGLLVAKAHGTFRALRGQR